MKVWTYLRDMEDAYLAGDDWRLRQAQIENERLRIQLAEVIARASELRGELAALKAHRKPVGSAVDVSRKVASA